jgi:Zn-finger nucleic acid-binding protein
MICLVCGERMKKIVEFGVELDLCPGCEGVWLERGELEKVLAYAAPSKPEAVPSSRVNSPPAKAPWPVGPHFGPARPCDERPRSAYHPPYPRHHHTNDDDEDDADRYRRYSGERGCYDQHGQHGPHDRNHGRPYKRKHWLSEILDSFGD